MDVDDEPTWLELNLAEGTTFDFQPVDEDGRKGLIFNIEGIKIPSEENVDGFEVTYDSKKFEDHLILDPPGNFTLVVLFANPELERL